MAVIPSLWVCVPIYLIITLSKAGAQSSEDPPKNLLKIRQIKISGTVAELQWEGLVLSSIDKCEYSKFVNDSKDANITLPYKPTDTTLILTDLRPSTQYGIILVCYDVKERMYKSSLSRFVTSPDNTVIISSSPPSSTLPPHFFTVPYTSWPTTSSTMEVYRRRFTPERSPTELGLGVACGLIGAGVFGVVGYYVIKEYRRRIRIRRFLQYRRHENETFPDLADPEDEPVDEGIGL